MARHSILLTLIAVLAVGGCSSQDADTESTPETTVSTTIASTTTIPADTAAATSQDAVLTFDGEQCSYEGPTVGDLSQPFSLTLVNDSDLFTFGVVVWVPPDLLDEVMPTVGTDFPATDEEGEDSGLTDTFYVEVPSGSEQSLTGLAMPAPGTYVLDCATADGATMLHMWRPAAIEFS